MSNQPLPQLYAFCTWWNDNKGYGFVKAYATGAEYFCSFAVIKSPGFRTLRPGQKVKVEVGLGKRGPQVTRCLLLAQSEAEQLDREGGDDDDGGGLDAAA